MKQFYLLVLLVGLMTPAGLHAQKVYKKDDRVILDLTVTTGMPKDAVTNISKTEAYNSSLPDLPSQIKFNQVGGMDNDHNNPINATAFQKLEIAPYDMNSRGELDMTGTGSMITVWNLAYRGCKNLSYNGTGWRLPTQRELMLIYIFKPAIENILENVRGIPFEPDGYWSITEFENLSAWIMIFNVGFMSHNFKAEAYRVRCVREVTD